MTIPSAIVAAAQNAGIDPQVALAVANRESGMNPNIRDGAVGEIGIFQLRPTTAADLGYSVAQLRDPLQNIQAGVAYLARMFSKYQDAAAAIAAYNAGPGRVDSALSNFGSDWFLHIPPSTQAYVTSVLGNVQSASSANAPAPAATVVPVTSTMFLDSTGLVPTIAQVPGPAAAPQDTDGSIWGTLAVAAAAILGVGFLLRD